MPLRTLLVSQRYLIFIAVTLLSAGFLATSLLSYYASRASIRDNIVNTELPLTSDNVYSEIQKDIVRPILISSMMSRDTFMRDWAVAGEKNPEQLTRYLSEIMSSYGAYTTFFVSDASKTYYVANGVLKTIHPDDPRDRWYYRVKEMNAAYDFNVDKDMANHDDLTFFINYKVYDYNHRFIGVAGVGLRATAVVKLMDTYQERYERQVYFVDTTGQLMLTGASGGPEGAHAGKRLSELASTRAMLAKLPKPASGTYQYSAEGEGHFLNVRFIPELNWYLFTDKREDSALSNVRSSLYVNLLICLVVTLVVLALLYRVVRRYQRHIEMLATLDTLTGLPNRRGFDLLAAQALREAQRDRQPLAALMLDIDHFKRLNDNYGHLAGDRVLAGFAQVLRGCLRSSDIICRWGGEEFIVLLRTDSAHAQQVAEKVRQRTEAQSFEFDGQTLRATTSVGMTSAQDGDTLQQLIARADQALYRAKQSGRNRLCLEMPRSPYEPA
ncbi:sensor domain-containing diguanylate cyclase [Pseudomonas sp. HR96]|uniref:sensor domain-containing diguanylate cyclase n=1 Tax=Pseudomonas sp. HR96 TaxID=1027966 RepID=UPI002A7567F1|nr:sensor domain-containing diguanylate cyclase [Pseudomonas sp. HR96]WPO99078.1 sensor domain-containing diguanylate cyclase [Pseudomonas sp. HR96]